MDLVLKVVVKTSSGRPGMFWACIIFEVTFKIFQVKPWDHLLPDEIEVQGVRTQVPTWHPHLAA